MNEELLLFKAPKSALTARESRIEGEYKVYPNCYLFKAGTYPGKGPNGQDFILTPEDLKARCQNTFGELSLNAEHLDFSDPRHGALTIFEDEIPEVGFIKSLWIDPKDETILRGETHIALWADAKLKGKGLSMEVPVQESKPFVGCALTYTPHIGQAALMSDLILAFKQSKGSKTWDGHYALREIHSMTASHGATCTPKANMSTEQLDFMSKPEGKMLQNIHDMVSPNGEHCSFIDENPTSMGYSQEKPMDEKQITENVTTGVFEKLKAFFTGSPEVAPEVKTLPVQIGKVDFTETAEFKALDQKNKDLEAEVVKLMEVNKAILFAQHEMAIDALVQEKQLTPAQKVDFSVFSSIEAHQGKSAMEVRAENTAMFDMMFSKTKVTTTPTLVNGITVLQQTRDQEAGKVTVDFTKTQAAVKELIPISFG